MDGVVEERDAAAKKTAKNLRDDQAEGKHHGPAKDGRLQRMSMAGVGMRMTGVARVRMVAVGMSGHAPILRAQIIERSPLAKLVRQFDTVAGGMD